MKPAAFLSSLLILASGCAAAGSAPVRIQLFGDSTQLGMDGATRRPASTPPAKALQAALDARFGPGATQVSERAVGSTTAEQLLNGTDGRNRPWPAEVAADIVVVNFGINEARLQVPLARYSAALDALGADVYETPNPVHGYPWANPAYAQAMRDVAARRHAVRADVDAWMRAQVGWQALVPDGAHPTAAVRRPS